jgi:hypothetical protein
MKTDNDTYKVVRAIRELENKDICHEYYDVTEFDLDTILSWYGISEEWNQEENTILKEYLLKMAYQDELKEVIRITDEESDPILASIPNRPAPSLKLLQLEHLNWKREMSKRKELTENHKNSPILFKLKKSRSKTIMTFITGANKILEIENLSLKLRWGNIGKMNLSP